MSEITKEVLNNLQETFSTKAEMTAHIESVQKATGANSEQLQKLENILVEQGNKINDMQKQEVVNDVPMSYQEQVEKILTENKESYNGFKAKSKPFNFAMKAAGTMTTSGNITGATTLLPYPQLIPGYNPYRWNPATYLDYASITSTNSARIAYVDEVSPDGAATAVSEGAEKPLIDKDDLVTVSSAVKVAAIVSVTDEMLDDVPFMASQINQRLLGEIRRVSSANIYTYIDSVNALSAIDAGLADMGGATPAMWQLIVAAKTTLAKANHTCTHIFLNPIDYARLLMLKGDAQNPIIISANEVEVHGVRVVSTNAQTVDKYLAADYNKLNVAAYKELNVEMGWNGDDFKYNRRTLRAEWRFHRYIMENDKSAFLCGDVTDDLTTLTA